jgi:cell division septation protein DedD
MFVYFPESSTTKDSKKLEMFVPNNEAKTNYGFEEFEISDFDFFVYRAHVLSSEDNANNLKEKVVNGGFPAFVESFGENKNLYAVYVGPFLSEDDIVNNIELIQTLSESKNGEISRWKL